MKKLAIAITAIMVFATVPQAFAGNTYDPGVNKRQKNQTQRIVKGMKSGSLTVRESAKLLNQQAKVHRFERRLKADGNLNTVERLRLHNRLNQASHNIYGQKHDAQHR